MAKKSTPMMGQYRRIKNELSPDTILFFRLGDFYEMFFDDAKEASRILDIALTKRNDIPMCGIPYHAADGYLAKIIRAGRKVAICDQVEDPKKAKGIVKREVTRVITAGTLLDEGLLRALATSAGHSYRCSDGRELRRFMAAVGATMAQTRASGVNATQALSTIR